MRAIDVGCPECFALPGQPCDTTPPHFPVLKVEGVHFGRIETAKFESLVQARMSGEPGFEPTAEQFNAAVMASGAI